MIRTPKPRARLRGEPNDSEPKPPARSVRAVGASETPIRVTKQPTTTFGNSASTFSRKNVEARISTPDPMIAPNRAPMP